MKHSFCVPDAKCLWNGRIIWRLCLSVPLFHLLYYSSLRSDLPHKHVWFSCLSIYARFHLYWAQGTALTCVQFVKDDGTWLLTSRRILNQWLNKFGLIYWLLCQLRYNKDTGCKLDIQGSISGRGQGFFCLPLFWGPSQIGTRGKGTKMWSLSLMTHCLAIDRMEFHFPVLLCPHQESVLSLFQKYQMLGCQFDVSSRYSEITKTTTNLSHKGPCPSLYSNRAPGYKSGALSLEPSC
jgi:hypothetical protein